LNLSFTIKLQNVSAPWTEIDHGQEKETEPGEQIVEIIKLKKAQVAPISSLSLLLSSWNTRKLITTKQNKSLLRISAKGPDMFQNEHSGRYKEYRHAHAHYPGDGRT
jgi:hypothetical protein